MPCLAYVDWTVRKPRKSLTVPAVFIERRGARVSPTCPPYVGFVCLGTKSARVAVLCSADSLQQYPLLCTCVGPEGERWTESRRS